MTARLDRSGPGAVRRESPPGAGQAGGPAAADTGWWPLAAICVAVFMLLMDVTVVTVALPQMRTDLSASLSGLQWVVAAYALTLAACQLTAGSLGDRLGRREMFAGGIVLFAVASAVCAAAPDTAVLIAARAVQGVGGAVMFTISLALVAQCYQGRRRAIAFGVRGGISGFAVAAGPLVGGLLTTALGWRWIFVLNLPLAVLAAAISLIKLPRADAAARQPIDWAGFAVFSAALGVGVYAVQDGNADGWLSPRILGCLAACAVLLAAFAWLERRAARPMLKLSRFRQRTFTGAQLAALLGQGSLFPLFVFLPLYFQGLLGFSALGTGARMLFVTVPVLLAAPLAGRLTTRVAPAALVTAGLAVLAVGVLLMHGLTAASSWTALIPGFIVAGAALAITLPPLGNLAIDVVEPGQAGLGSGVNNTFAQTGFSVGVAVYGVLFAHAISSRLSGSLPPAIAAHIPLAALSRAVANGGIADATGHVPAPARQLVSNAARAAFVAGLNQLFLTAAAVALAGAVITGLLCWRPAGQRN
jgi:EmrB/QacA subfamily drug resistance transporter